MSIMMIFHNSHARKEAERENGLASVGECCDDDAPVNSAPTHTTLQRWLEVTVR